MCNGAGSRQLKWAWKGRHRLGVQQSCLPELTMPLRPASQLCEQKHPQLVMGEDSTSWQGEREWSESVFLNQHKEWVGVWWAVLLLSLLCFQSSLVTPVVFDHRLICHFVNSDENNYFSFSNYWSIKGKFRNIVSGRVIYEVICKSVLLFSL